MAFQKSLEGGNGKARIITYDSFFIAHDWNRILSWGKSWRLVCPRQEGQSIGDHQAEYASPTWITTKCAEHRSAPVFVRMWNSGGTRMKAVAHIYAQWDQVGEHIGDDAAHLLDLGLVCDTTFQPEQGLSFCEILKRVMDAGGLCAPNLYPETCDESCRDSNWWKYSESECVRLLQIAGDRHASLGLGPLSAVNTYTPGNAYVSACRRLGIGYLLGFCAPIVIEDGGWEIAHYGSPLSPYFVGDEDFRKPEGGNRADSVLMSSMELRNPLVCANHWSEGPWCPLNALAVDRWLEPSNDPLPFLAIAEDWIRQSELSGRPLFFHINLQYFFADRCRAHNRRALEWLADQRDRGRLEIVGLQQWRERLKAGNGFERQTTYWRGEMMGFHVGHRPGRYPDVVVDEGLDFQAVWQRPDVLPKCFYDYTRKWEYPAFQPEGGAPASTDFSEIAVTVNVNDSGCEVRLQNPGKAVEIPLMLWGMGEEMKGPYSVQGVPEGWDSRMVPHPSGQGMALQLRGLCSSGATDFRIHVAGSGHTGRKHSRSWQDLAAAETFYYQVRPYTIIVAQTPEPFSVGARLRVDSPEPVRWERLCGIDYEVGEVKGNRLPLRFDGRRLVCWHRIWGVTADQIELEEWESVKSMLAARTREAISALESDVAPAAPGYQLFGNIRDIRRWDLVLARQAGDRERTMVEEMLRERIEGDEDIVIEAHPGLYLPRGSITKVLGHEFDRIHCEQGYAFREICVDYPQGWDWGAAAWVQWRHLRLKLSGLEADAACEYRVYLHAFDPEGRGISQRVHLYSIGNAPGDEVVEVCVVKDWPLPAGVDGRWNREAMCSFSVPALCRHWPEIGVWIVPLQKIRLYDWVAERGAPGMVSHLWVTRRSLKIPETHRFNEAVLR